MTAAAGIPQASPNMFRYETLLKLASDREVLAGQHDPVQGDRDEEEGDLVLPGRALASEKLIPGCSRR